ADFARYVVSTLLHTVQQTETSSAAGRAIGVFNGLGSYIYVLSHLAVLWNDTALLDQAERTMEELEPLIDGDREFDLLSGSAGCIGALGALNSARRSERVKNLVERCASHLVNSAMEAETGLAWNTRIKSDQPLTGFSHGVAGIAWALVEAGVISGNARYRGTARQALEYERACFSPAEQNWPDFRPSALRPNGKASNGHPTYCALWCHGSGGIGLSRALMLRHWDEALLYDETAIAARTTLKWGFGRNHSLCHGDAGNLDILLMISMITHDRRLHDKTYKVAGRFVDGLDRHGWLCGTPNWVETPGLMAGLAGVGYGLLRLAEPEKVPSIIAIEKPVQGLN